MKSQEELNALKEEVKMLKAKLQKLTDEELEQVTGGTMVIVPDFVKNSEDCKGLEQESDS